MGQDKSSKGYSPSKRSIPRGEGAPGPSPHDQPLRLIAHVEKSMVVEKLREVTGWESPKPGWVRRPDRSTHGQDELFDKQGRVFFSFQVLGENHGVVALLQEFQSLSSETKDVQNHTMERQFEQVGALGEKGIQRARAELQSCLFASQAEAHPRVLPRNVDSTEQLDKVGVSHLVKDDEPCIYSVGFVSHIYVDGVSVSSDIVIFFENREVMGV